VNVNLFINSYRIKEAKRMLLDASFNHLSIEGIARSVGFNSKSAFNATFKKITGMTPSFYQRSALRILEEKRSSPDGV
jgi:AraC-like DNA-binding protein